MQDTGRLLLVFGVLLAVIGGAYGQYGGVWAHDAATGKIAIDPVLGRISFPANQLRRRPPLVTFHYGFSAEMGGGEYARASTFDADPTATNIRLPSFEKTTSRV